MGDNSAISSLLGQKENVETDLANKAAVVNAETGNNNRRLLNNLDTLNFNRKLDTQARWSQNVANLTEDLTQENIDSKLSDMDKKKLELIKMKYKRTGVLDRAGIAELLN